MSGPFTQISLAINRSMAINFPYRFNRPNTFSVTKIALIFWWISAILVSLPSLMDGCGFIFYVEFVSWGPMDDPCSAHLSEYVTYLVISMAICSFSINCFSIFKILQQSQIDQTSALRKRRRRKMFIQCVIQDCTHSIDVINNTFLYSLIDAVWFQFLCGAISALTVILLDGVLMSVLHQKSATPANTAAEKTVTRHFRSSSVITTTVV
ncbi:unnamed protein product [Caenorhabditis angaria]|uniref:G-protein coupled receptors family 1 profile domain-containing protein n=1 Tax=Caenorhabditis angaria TaxID=860376 RepID=A0A9P1IZ24_9PELO|nr:unnamed protein product [Caenorhabditis angaria]